VSAADRDRILQRIRTALQDVPASERPADVPVPRGYHRSHANSDLVDLVDLFAERAADYRATVTRAHPHDAPAVIATILQQRSITDLAVPAGLPQDLLVLSPALLRPDEPALTVSELDTVGGVLTTVAIAIAVTGTVVLDGGDGQGRRALTLLPDYHLCVVPADRIVADVPDAIRRLDPTRPLTLISGPSATSDIENTRIEGVHGPRILDILIIDNRNRQED
jgi:L-lactate dehydrogenase complex protein LldG